MNSLRVRIPIPNTTMKNIVVDVCDVVLKVNATDRKMVKTLDLWGEVHTPSVVYASGTLEVRLLKCERAEWPTLLWECDDRE